MNERFVEHESDMRLLQRQINKLMIVNQSDQNDEKDRSKDQMV